jgi:hypothetical protein
MKGITDYGYNRQIRDTGICLEQNTMKSILELQFNLGEGVAHLQFATKGPSILDCRAWASHKTKEIKEQELALNVMEKTRLFDIYLKYVKGAFQHPASNYWDLKVKL